MDQTVPRYNDYGADKHGGFLGVFLLEEKGDKWYSDAKFRS